MINSQREVPPRRTVEIRKIATELRSNIDPNCDRFPIGSFLDVVLPQIFPSFSLQVIEKDLLGENHGLTLPDDNLIMLREDVYDGMMRGVGRDRFTAAHELGHLVLHRGVRGFARRFRGSVPAYADCEWQANQFAAELLAPPEIVKKARSIEEIAELCGLSRLAASHRDSGLRREGILK